MPTKTEEKHFVGKGLYDDYEWETPVVMVKENVRYTDSVSVETRLYITKK